MQTQESWRVAGPQAASFDPLLECLVLLTKTLHRPFSAESLSAGLPLVNHQLTPELFIRAAARAGLTAKVVKRPLAKISSLVLPAVLLLNDGQACVLTEFKDADDVQGSTNVAGGRTPEATAAIIQPESGAGVKEIALADLNKVYSGYAIFAQPVFRFDARTEQSATPSPHHWFWGTLLKSWSIYGEVLVASLLINIFALASPLFIMNVYDRVVPNRAVETLWVLAIGVTIAFTFDIIMRTLRGYFIDIAGKRSDVILSARIFEQVLGIQMAARPASVGAFANNLHEFESFRDFFTSATLTTLIDLPFALLFIAVIALLGGPLAWIPIAAIPLVIGVGMLLQAPLNDTVKQTYQHLGQKHATLIETLTGLETLKSAGAESPMQRRWEQTVGVLATLGLKTRFLSALGVNFSTFVQQMATIAVVVYGVYLIAAGTLTMGALIACTLLAGRALAPLSQVAGLLARYHQSVATLRTLNKIMDLPVERPAGKAFLHRPTLQGGIEFKDVSFSYPNQQVGALNGVSFKVAPGERVAIIGRIGSGKSTIEKLILGLYPPGSGAILMDGTDIRQMDPAVLRRNVGYVPQDIVLFYGSVKDNIVLGAPYADDGAVLRAAEIAGVTEFIARHPQGFDMQTGERGENLSGGQRQTIAIARALLLEPPILLLDEPSNAMDNSTEERFKQKLAALLEGRTLLLVTHRASLLTLVNRVIVVDGGRVVADGPKEQVLHALSEGKLQASKK